MTVSSKHPWLGISTYKKYKVGSYFSYTLGHCILNCIQTLNDNLKSCLKPKL